jgi:hypothetical protein
MQIVLHLGYFTLCNFLSRNRMSYKSRSTCSCVRESAASIGMPVLLPTNVNKQAFVALRVSSPAECLHAQFPALHSIKCLSDVSACVLPLSWLAIRIMQHILDQIDIIYLLLEWLFRHSSHLYLVHVFIHSLFFDTLGSISVSKLASQVSECITIRIYIMTA